MNPSELKAQLRKEMQGDFETLLDEVARSIQEASPGRVIADSEEAVRDAAAQFRQRLFQKGLTLRTQAEGPAFSPSEDRRRKGVAQQGPSDGDVFDDQRPGGP